MHISYIYTVYMFKVIYRFGSMHWSNPGVLYSVNYHKLWEVIALLLPKTWQPIIYVTLVFLYKGVYLGSDVYHANDGMQAVSKSIQKSVAKYGYSVWKLALEVCVLIYIINMFECYMIKFDYLSWCECNRLKLYWLMLISAELHICSVRPC
jgi:hypothetical protein